MTAPTTTHHELDQHTGDLVRHLATLNAQIADLTIEADQVKAQLRERLTVGAYTIDGRPAVAITTNRRFDPALAADVLPPDLLALCTETKVDGAKAKKVLPPALYELAMREIGQPVVRLA